MTSPAASPRRPGISVMITAMNEEGNLEPTVRNIVDVVRDGFEDYEILVMDDGSTDQTPAITARLHAEDPRVMHYRSPVNRGLGHNYRTGIREARQPLLMWIAGNNIVSPQAMRDMCAQADQADFVYGYMLSDVRGWQRRWISRTFAQAMNSLFDLKLPYYTGPWISRTAAIRTIRTICDGSMITPEIPIRMILGGFSSLSVGYHPMPRTAGKTKTFRLANIIFVLKSIVRLKWNLRSRPRSNQT